MAPAHDPSSLFPDYNLGKDAHPAARTETQLFVLWFQERFLEERGEPYDPSKVDFIKASRLFQRHQRAAVEARALRMLHSEVLFHFQRASPAHLFDRWNEFAVEIRQMSPLERRELERQREIERLFGSETRKELSDGFPG